MFLPQNEDNEEALPDKEGTEATELLQNSSADDNCSGKDFKTTLSNVVTDAYMTLITRG